jgi:hypothetical protein
MNIPHFTAQASLYRTSNRYRSSVHDSGGSPSDRSVIAAYMPGQETQRACNNCLDGCAGSLAECSAISTAPLAACVFPPACPAAAAAAGAALAACNLASLACIARCNILRCCPHACQTPNPFDPGAGCCDKGETCVDRYDPNSRQGCCPTDQAVCGGKCCARGFSCCGDTCCPPNYYCLTGGVCSEFPGPSLWPDDWKPVKPPRRPINYCKIGYEPCGSTCCPPGLECCSVGGGKVACMTNCLH